MKYKARDGIDFVQKELFFYGFRSLLLECAQNFDEKHSQKVIREK